MRRSQLGGPPFFSDAKCEKEVKLQQDTMELKQKLADLMDSALNT